MPNTTDTARLRELLGAAKMSHERLAVELKSLTAVSHFYSGDAVALFVADLECLLDVVGHYSTLLDELDALRARVAELEAELSQCRQAIGLLTTTTPEVEMNGADPVAMAMKMVDSLADRDARMRREGAAEWLTSLAEEDAFKRLEFMHVERLKSEAAGACE